MRSVPRPLDSMPSVRRIGTGPVFIRETPQSLLSGGEMPPTRRFFAGLALLSLVIAFPLTAQSGRIRGRVLDNTGAALPGAVVTVEGTLLRAVAGAQGGYGIGGVPAGTHTVRARLIGYTSASVQVAVPAGGEASQDFALTRSAVQLAPVDVVVGSRARHTAAEELAVPVDVFGSEQIKQIASTETAEDLPAFRKIMDTNVFGMAVTFQPFVAPMRARAASAASPPETAAG